MVRSPNFEGKPPLPVALPSGAEETTESQSWRGTYLRSRYVPLTGETGRLQGWVELSRLESDPHDFMSYVWLLLASFGLSALLATAGGYVFAKRILRPVSRLTEAAGEIGATDLNVRLPVDAKVRDELTDLAETFNEMLSRLEASFERERRFTAHAAHELRTPLARMRSEIELGRCPPRSREDMADALAVLHEDVTQMSEIVDRLLTLSRLEALDRQACEPVNLSALCEKHLARIRRRVKEQGIGLQHEIEPDVTVTANCVHLEEVLDNLLENALKYTPSGGAISVHLQQEEAVRLVVADTGVGFSAEEKDQLFDRFFRSNRPEVQAQAGSGLGLAVVKTIITAYGGAVEAHSPGKGQGSRFEVTVPAAEHHHQ